MATIHPPAPELKIPSEYAARMLLAVLAVPDQQRVAGTTPPEVDQTQAIMYIRAHCVSKLMCGKASIMAFLCKMYMDGQESPNPDLARIYAMMVSNYQRPLLDKAYADRLMAGVHSIRQLKYGDNFPAHMRHHLGVMANPEATDDERKESRTALDVLVISNTSPAKTEVVLGSIQEMVEAKLPEPFEVSPSFTVPVVLHDRIFAEAFRRFIGYIQTIPEAPDRFFIDLMRQMQQANESSDSDSDNEREGVDVGAAAQQCRHQ